MKAIKKVLKLLKIFGKLFMNLMKNKKKKFLFFSTGSDRAPIKGLASIKFIITKHGDN